MRISRLVTVGALAGATLALPVTAAVASPHGTTCDSYSKTCAQVKPAHYVKPAAVINQNFDSPSTLPFTGADVAAMTIVGLGALGVGSGLVISGRRRRSSTATA